MFVCIFFFFFIFVSPFLQKATIFMKLLPFLVDNTLSKEIYSYMNESTPTGTFYTVRVDPR